MTKIQFLSDIGHGHFFGRRWPPRSDEISHRKWSPSRWSPSRLSPASRQRYDALHDRDDSGARAEPNMFKSNSAPTTSQVAAKTTEFDVPDLPSPSARSRFTFSTTLRTISLSPRSSSKNTSLLARQQQDTPPLRFELQTSRLGTGAILPGDENGPRHCIDLLQILHRRNMFITRPRGRIDDQIIQSIGISRPIDFGQELLNQTILSGACVYGTDRTKKERKQSKKKKNTV